MKGVFVPVASSGDAENGRNSSCRWVSTIMLLARTPNLALHCSRARRVNLSLDGSNNNDNVVVVVVVVVTELVTPLSSPAS